MKVLGRFAFMTLLPLLRRYLQRTERVYVLISSGGEILLVKNWLSRQKWQLPGGGVKKKESAAAAVVRELEEELGILVSADRLTRLTGGTWQTDGLGFRYQVFKLDLQEKPQMKLLRPELTQAAWLATEKINPRDVNPEVYPIIGRGPGLL